jgi:asparagine synthetase B (glutamine-hydrolysing)
VRTTELSRQSPRPAEEQLPSWVATLHRRRPGGNGAATALEVETAGGATPEVATEGPHRVVFDGWLYNREELRRVSGAAADANAARLILDAYRAIGHDVAGRVNGRFVLIIWDAAAEELVCVRDAVGAYPLFWAERGEEILLSTGIVDLVRQPGVSKALNRIVLAEHLCCRWPDMEDTHFAAVRRVPPGHAFVLGPRGRRLYRHWDPVPKPGSDDWVKKDELERFDGLFDQAVRRCLLPGPAGIFLSGGLDSVSVAAVATDISRTEGRPIPWALSLGFPHPDCNEEQVQRAVAAQLGIPQELVWYDEAVGRQGRVRAGLEASRTAPVPLIGMWPPAYRHLAGVGKDRGCRVILTGSGGDEMLLASTYRAADLLRRLQLRRLWETYRSIQRSYPWPVLQTMKATFWDAAARPLLQRTARSALEAVAPSVLHSRWRRKIAEGTPAWVTADPELWEELLTRAVRLTATWPPKGDFYYGECRGALDNVTASMEMERLFEDGRRVGIPIQEPYWDPDLQAFLYRVPPDDLEQGGRTKGLVRGMLARRFPDAGFERQKKVIGTEFANDAFVTEIPQALQEMGGPQGLAELGLVDQAKLDQAVARMASDPGERRKSYLLWHVLSLEAWVRPRI